MEMVGVKKLEGIKRKDILNREGTTINEISIENLDKSFVHHSRKMGTEHDLT